MKKVIVTTIYRQCEWCKGTGLEEIEGYTADCWKCKGHGENVVNETKTIERIEANEEQASVRQ